MEKKILIINDDESIREILQMYLSNYKVVLAKNGIEGLKKAALVLPDLILLDVVMPQMDGYEVCRQLKVDVKLKDIPVIFVSSLLETSDKIKGLNSGGVDFINAMADCSEIIARIEIHLKISDLTQQLQTFNQELILKQKILNEDLHAAAVIQQSLLPIHVPIIPNLEISWFCQPCELVGGDICSISPVNEESSVFYILDVSGHGVPSAMVTVSITQYLQQKTLLDSFLSPSQSLIALNKDYPFDKFNMFSSIFYMNFNSQNGKLLYSSAGHPPAVYLSSKETFQLLSTDGPLIGINPFFLYEEKEKIFQNGDKIILYTDGVIELKNPEGELYGSERFYALLEELKFHPIDEIIRRVNKTLEEFRKEIVARDDISVLGIEFKNTNEFPEK